MTLDVNFWSSREYVCNYVITYKYILLSNLVIEAVSISYI